MKILPMIICSNERKDTVLKTTLESFRQTDWPEEPICVFDGNIHNDKFLNIHANCLCLLNKFLETDYDYLLYLEDDVIFNRHLYHNLINWTPIKYDFLFLGSLFHPAPDKMRPYFDCDLGYRRDNNYLMSDTCLTSCSQAYIIKREAVKYLVGIERKDWDSITPKHYPDVVIPRIIQRVYSVFFYYLPSIVNHQRAVSLFGHGHAGESSPSNFDMDFKI